MREMVNVAEDALESLEDLKSPLSFCLFCYTSFS